MFRNPGRLRSEPFRTTPHHRYEPFPDPPRSARFRAPWHDRQQDGWTFGVRRLGAHQTLVKTDFVRRPEPDPAQPQGGWAHTKAVSRSPTWHIAVTAAHAMPSVCGHHGFDRPNVCTRPLGRPAPRQHPRRGWTSSAAIRSVRLLAAGAASPAANRKAQAGRQGRFVRLGTAPSAGWSRSGLGARRGQARKRA